MRTGLLAVLSVIGCLLIAMPQGSEQQEGEGGGGETSSCPSLSRKSVVVTCEAGGAKIACEEVRTGTKARVSWAKNSLGSKGKKASNSGGELVCQPSGEWKPRFCKKAPPGYTLLSGFGLYKYHKEMTSWENAGMTCTKAGAHLLLVESLAELHAVAKLVTNEEGQDFHAELHYGVTDKILDGTFLTVNGEPMVEVPGISWGPGEPARGRMSEVEDCVVIKFPEYTLHDIECFGTHRKQDKAFVCKMDLN